MERGQALCFVVELCAGASREPPEGLDPDPSVLVAPRARDLCRTSFRAAAATSRSSERLSTRRRHSRPERRIHAAKSGYVLLSSQENQTLTVWLASFTTSRGTAWGPLMAAATLTSLPIVIFFALVQRRVAFGLTAGAVRG